MKTTRPGVFAAGIAAAALLLLLLGATGLGPPSAASGEPGLTSDYVQETRGTPSRYATTVGGDTVWVATATTPAPMVNASYNYVVLREYQNRAIGSLRGNTLLPDLQTSSVGKTTRHPDKNTTITTITMTSTTSSDTIEGQTSYSYHDHFSEGGPEDSHNESRWRRFQHEPLRLPNQFMTRFLNTLMYLADVITADVISALLFGRWRPRYYQRARKNRIDWRRRRRFRRFRMNAADVAMTIWDGCVNLHDTLCEDQNDVSGPTYQMISNLQLTEYPVTLSTFADVPTSEIVAAVASARCSALVSIASISPPISAIPAQSLLVSRVPPPESTSLNPRPTASPLPLLMLKAPETSAVVSCLPRAFLPDTGLEIALRPAVSPRLSWLLAAAPPTTPPSLASSQCLTEAASEETMLRAKRAPTATSPSAMAATNGCAVGTVNTLVVYNTAERSVTTPVEESDGQADTADESPPSPFFVSESYTPDSTCYVSAHGVAYTRISMSYTHQFNHPTKGDTQGETPTTTQAGDVSDILWTAANSRMQCKWAQTCTQTTSSEYYRSSVEAVFASCFIPDEDDIVVLNELVRNHL